MSYSKEEQELLDKWYYEGVKAGRNEGWLVVEKTLEETFIKYKGRFENAEDLIYKDFELWEETDYFQTVCQYKMIEDFENLFLDDRDDLLDFLVDLKDSFWRGYIDGRYQIRIDLYKIAEDIIEKGL